MVGKGRRRPLAPVAVLALVMGAIANGVQAPPVSAAPGGSVPGRIRPAPLWGTDRQRT